MAMIHLSSRLLPWSKVGASTVPVCVLLQGFQRNTHAVKTKPENKSRSHTLPTG